MSGFGLSPFGIGPFGLGSSATSTAVAAFGFGMSPAGVSPYGFGTPAVADTPGGVIFRDTLTGAMLSSRKINPATGDFEIDAFGRITGMTSGQQAMFLALKTELGTSALADLGNELSRIAVIGNGFARDVQEKVRVATSRGVALGLFSNVVTTVTSNGSRGFAVVRWFDETTQTEQTLTL